MKKDWVCAVTASLIVMGVPLCYAQDDEPTSPQAVARTHAQNYKDMVLAECIATAYKDEPEAAKDAGSSVSALRDWTEYDLEMAPDAIKAVMERYLGRDYHNPLVDAEVRGVRFDFLKCMDLYHSKELDVQVKRWVIDPRRTSRRNNASPARSR